MMMDPLCEVAKVYGHSWWPSLHWWLSLMAAEQAAWVSGIGSLAAALAATWAARKATKLAMLPIEQRERNRLTTCRSIAPAIGPELRRASEEASKLAKILGDGSRAHEIRTFLNRGILRRTTMLERSLEKFDLFGTEDGGRLSATTAAILDLRARVDYWIEREDARPMPQIAHMPRYLDIDALRPLEAEANMIVHYVDALQPTLEKYGGSKTVYEA